MASERGPAEKPQSRPQDCPLSTRGENVNGCYPAAARLAARPPLGGCVSAETTVQGFVKEPCSLVPMAQTTLVIRWHQSRGLPSRPFLHKKSLPRPGLPSLRNSLRAAGGPRRAALCPPDMGQLRGAGGNSTPVTMGQAAGRQRKMEKALQAHHFKMSLGSQSYFLTTGSGTQRWCQREEVPGRPQGSRRVMSG